MMRTIGSMEQLSMDKRLECLRRAARAKRNRELRIRLAEAGTAECVLSRFLTMRGLGESTENALNFV